MDAYYSKAELDKVEAGDQRFDEERERTFDPSLNCDHTWHIDEESEESCRHCGKLYQHYYEERKGLR